MNMELNKEEKETGGLFPITTPTEDEEKDVKKKVLTKMIKICGQCDYNFETTKELMFHLKNSPGHLPRCVHCDTNFADFNNYVKHVGKFHMRESEIVCQECGKTSKTHEQQRLHWNSVHKVEEDLYCNLCGRECQNMAKLRKHTKFCLTKDPDIAAQERMKNEAENERVRDQLQTWTHEQYLEWRQRKEEESNKSSASSKTPRKKKEQNGEKTPRKKRKSAENGSLSKVKKLKPEDDSDSMPSPGYQAENNFVENFLEQKQKEIPENDHFHVVKDESDFKGVKEECPSEDSDNNNDTTTDDPFDDMFNDSTSYNDDSRDFNMNSDDENMIKAEVKLETESGDESLTFDNPNGDDDDDFPVPKSEVKEEKEKVKKKKSPRKGAFPTRELLPEEEEDLRCRECDHTFKRLKYLKTHIRTIHGPDAGQKKTPSPRKTALKLSDSSVEEAGEYPCEFCGKTYKSRALLKGHVNQVHEKIKTCRLCQEQTTDLALHRKEKHPETVIDPEQGLNCRECNKSFKTIKILRAHLRLQHGTEKKTGVCESTICPVCAKEVRSVLKHYDYQYPFILILTFVCLF